MTRFLAWWGAVGFATAVQAASFGGVEVPPPLPARPVVDTLWGTQVTDPYRFLESVKDPEVQQWMRSEADATGAILSRIPGRDALLARFRTIEDGASGLVDSPYHTRNGRWFFQKRDPGDNQFRLVWRERADGADHLLFDPEALRKATGEPHAILDFTPSPDGKRVAYAVQKGGGEIGELHVIDVDSGRELITPVDGIRYASVAWLDDASGFFYNRLHDGYDKLPPTERFNDNARHFRALDAAGTDRVVFQPSRAADLALPPFAIGYVAQVPGTRTAAMWVALGVERYGLLYVADLDSAIQGTAQWRPVVTAADNVADVTEGGGYFYLRSAKGAPRYKLLRVPVAAPDIRKAEVVLPPGTGVITGLAAARDALYVTRRDGATTHLLRIPHAKAVKVRAVALPYAGSAAATADPLVPGVALQLGGWTHAYRPYHYDPAQARVTALPFVRIGVFDAPRDIEAREITYRSYDGTEVPMSIITKKGLQLDGSNPTILYGYGAYGITDDPFFNPRIYAWLERGGVYAVAHVRGGGIYGDEWHMAGRRATKPNTWKDGIAAAQWLIANRYTSPAKLAIYGGSAGGIFVGRSITERPDLFAAAVPVVGWFDAVRIETSANGVANIPEFGTVKKEGEFRALEEMSSYDHVKPGTAYPGVMFVHGVNDIRVDVWQSLKMASRLATATSSGKPVLLRLEYDSGHGQGSTRAQLQARTADVFAFMLWQFGDPEFQPRSGP